MSRFVPVSFEKWAEMVKAQSDLVRYKEMCDELDVECTRLKAEVEAQAKRWAESEDLISHYKEQRDEVINDCQCARLKAEVEMLTKQNALATPRHLIASQDITSLREQVERLTKAGDAMALDFETYFPTYNTLELVKDWNAAKEGKQP